MGTAMNDETKKLQRRNSDPFRFDNGGLKFKAKYYKESEMQ